MPPDATQGRIACSRHARRRRQLARTVSQVGSSNCLDAPGGGQGSAHPGLLRAEAAEEAAVLQRVTLRQVGGRDGFLHVGKIVPTQHNSATLHLVHVDALRNESTRSM